MVKKGITDRASLSLYRAYRPHTFEDVRGQEHVTSVLKAAVAQGKVAHAYLFAGSRGTGKTSMARILAKALKTSDEDVYEMDAASNRGIEEVRQLREGVATLPFSSTYKFYIIDEAHALTKDAWGAFLKTLEEPPEHAIFVLCTTELEKIPETIISRCQTFAFKKPSHETLKKLVLDVAKKEGVVVEPAGAELVALMGEGSFRDTLGILQKVLTLSGDKKLSESEVAKVVGAPSSLQINAFLDALAKKKVDQALKKFHEALDAGSTASVFTLLAITKVRSILLIRFVPQMKKEIGEQLGEEELKVLESLAGKENAALNADLLAGLIGAYVEMQRAPIPAVSLELALYRVLG